jgi:hypothetical protein
MKTRRKGDLHVNGRMILKRFSWRVWGCEWYKLAEDRIQGWTLENAVMNLRISKIMGYFLSNQTTIIFSRVMCSLELSRSPRI